MFRPGETCRQSGIYGIYDGRKKISERTIVEGEPFPPTPKSGMYYKLVRATNH